MNAGDPLYLFLLIELSCFLAAGLAFLFFRSSKYVALYTSNVKELMEAKQDREALRKQLAVKQKPVMPEPGEAARTPEPPLAEDPHELEKLREKLHAVLEELDQKNKRMEALQAKFADLEKEYMVLYQQQQKQQEQPDIP